MKTARAHAVRSANLPHGVFSHAVPLVPAVRGTLVRPDQSVPELGCLRRPLVDIEDPDRVAHGDQSSAITHAESSEQPPDVVLDPLRAQENLFGYFAGRHAEGDPFQNCDIKIIDGVGSFG